MALSIQTTDQARKLLYETIGDESKVPDHSGRRLDDHLLGVWRLLRDWKCQDPLPTAGLLHSIYGTSSFKHQTVAKTRRAEIADKIGKPAEGLIYQYCSEDRASLFENTVLTHPDSQPKLRDRTLLTLMLADALEQRPHRSDLHSPKPELYHLSNNALEGWKKIVSSLLIPSPSDVIFK